MNPAQPRLPYRKPTIERITLVGEKIAAVPNCKRATGGARRIPTRVGPSGGGISSAPGAATPQGS